jgi:hypothetical protein
MATLALVGTKITEVSILKSIIKHGLFVVYIISFSREKMNANPILFFRAPKLSFTRNTSGSPSGPALSESSSDLPSISSK